MLICVLQFASVYITVCNCSWLSPTIKFISFLSRYQ